MNSPRRFCILATLLVALTSVSVGQVLAIDTVSDLFSVQNAENTALSIGDKSISESGLDYYMVEYWDGTRLWSNEGESWGQLDASFELGGIWGVDGQDIWIADNRDHGIFHKHNGTWVTETLPGFGGLVTDVFGFGRDNVFAIGSQDNIDTTNLFHYNGLSWLEVATRTGFLGYRALWGASANDMYMVGLGGSIGRFNGSEIQPMNSGVTTQLTAIWGTGSHNVYASGVNGTLLHYDGNSWQPVAHAAGTANLHGIWGSSEDNIYVAGLDVLLHFDGTSWSQVSDLPVTASLRDVYGTSASDVYVVGHSGTVLHYDGVTWTNESIPEGTNFAYIWGGLRTEGDQYWKTGWGASETGTSGINNRVYGMMEVGGNLAVCGQFTEESGNPANYIARWSGNEWLPIYASTGPNDEVHDMITFGSDLICAGEFTAIDGTPINCVAAWNGANWRQLGAGLLLPPGGDSAIAQGVWELIEFEGNLYALGEPRCTAMWDGSSWTVLSLDGDVTGDLFEATIHNNELYAVGPEFGSGCLKKLVGTTFVSVDTSLSGSVFSIMSDPAGLYVGGRFFDPTAVGEPDLIYIALWDGSGWQLPTAAMSGTVLTMRHHPDGVVVGGIFTTINDSPYNSIALWDKGDTWTQLGSGIQNIVWDAIVDGSNFTIAGDIGSAGNHPAGSLARWEPQILEIPAPPASGPASPGEDYTMSINIGGVPGSNPVFLHYRLRDNPDNPELFETARMYPGTNKDGMFTATIPGDFFGDLGFQYYVSTGSGTNAVFYPPAGPSEPAFAGVTMASEVLNVLIANQYIMMGVPFNPDKNLNGILTDALGSYDKSKWRCGRWDPTSASYDEYPNVDAVIPGRGYWLIQKNPVNIPATGVTTSTVGNVVITLEPGWNMIATPYNFEISWNSVIKGPNVENRLVARTGGGYADVNVMNPWQGYWVRNLALTGTTITIPPSPIFKSLDTETTPAKKADTVWEISLSAERGDRFDRANIAGVSSSAEPGVDRQDFFEAPSMPGDVSLYFEVNNENKTESLSRDIRGTFTDGESWEMVLKHEGGGTVDLTIDGCQNVPAQHNIVLITGNQTFNLRESSEISVTVGSSGKTSMRLAVGNPLFVEEQISSLPRPYALRQVYPNPFNPKANVSFALPRAGRVSIDIFDVRGRLVKNLVDDSYEAGLHEESWTGTDNDGRAVSTGVYFCHMRSGDFVQNQKMTLVR